MMVQICLPGNNKRKKRHEIPPFCTESESPSMRSATI